MFRGTSGAKSNVKSQKSKVRSRKSKVRCQTNVDLRDFGLWTFDFGLLTDTKAIPELSSDGLGRMISDLRFQIPDCIRVLLDSVFDLGSEIDLKSEIWNYWQYFFASRLIVFAFLSVALTPTVFSSNGP